MCRFIKLSFFILLIYPFFVRAQDGFGSMMEISVRTDPFSIDIVWPGNVSVIPPYEFKDDESIKKIVISEGVVAIGEYTFLGCTNLEEVVLPASLREIGEGAFRECKSLKSLVIPEGVKIIPPYMCTWDENLQNVSLPTSIEDIGRNAFAYCYNLKDISLPVSLNHIGPNAFSYCKALKEIVLPVSITELESYAFSGCDSLRKAVLPANPSLLGEFIFTGCKNLREIECQSEVPPPFDCDSPLFDPSEKKLWAQCRLIVPQKSETLYRNAPGWSNFFKSD